LLDPPEIYVVRRGMILVVFISSSLGLCSE